MLRFDDHAPAALLAGTLAVTLIAAALPTTAHAAAPAPGCRPASKIEYQSAKQQGLLRTMAGAYVRTGHIWHRFYWYCLR